mgnify:CR=1 FL=1
MEDLNLEVRESRAFKRNMFLVFISVPQSLVLKYMREGEGLSVRIGGGGQCLWDHSFGFSPCKQKSLISVRQDSNGINQNKQKPETVSNVKRTKTNTTVYQ